MKLTGLDLQYNNQKITVLCESDLTKITASSVQHLHTHWMTELHGIVSGHGLICTKYGKQLLKPGDCVLVGPFVPHYVISSEAGNTLYRLEAYLGVDKNNGSENSYASFINQQDVRIWSLDQPSFSYYEKAVEELSACKAGYREAAAAYMQLLLTELVRQDNLNLFSPPKGKSRSVEEFQIAVQIDTFFTQNYNKPITINDLASYLNLSSRQTQRLVVRYCGTSFRQELIQVRTEFAKRYLIETDLLVSQIAELVGYEYTSSFCKVFYTQTGQSPKDYRRKIKQQLSGSNQDHAKLLSENLL